MNENLNEFCDAQIKKNSIEFNKLYILQMTNAYRVNFINLYIARILRNQRKIEKIECRQIKVEQDILECRKRKAEDIEEAISDNSNIEYLERYVRYYKKHKKVLNKKIIYLKSRLEVIKEEELKNPKCDCKSKRCCNCDVIDNEVSDAYFESEGDEKFGVESFGIEFSDYSDTEFFEKV